MRPFFLVAALCAACAAPPTEPAVPRERPATACERVGVTPSPVRAYRLGPQPYAPPHEIPFVVGGSLASHVPLTNLSVGSYWFLRYAEPQPRIALVAHRLDEPTAPVRFEAVGYATPMHVPEGWTSASWYYRTAVTAVDVLPIPGGCWRVLVEHGRPGDSVVYLFKRVPAPISRY